MWYIHGFVNGPLLSWTSFTLLFHLITCYYSSATDNTYLFRNPGLQKQRLQCDLTEHSFVVVMHLIWIRYGSGSNFVRSWKPMPKFPLVLTCKCPAVQYQYLERHDSLILSNSRCTVYLVSKSQLTYRCRGAPILTVYSCCTMVCQVMQMGTIIHLTGY
jgi:hypothetical protein